MSTRFAAALLVLLAALALAGCGDDDSSSSSSSGSSDKGYSSTSSDEPSSSGEGALELGVDGNKLEFDKDELTAEAGSVTLKLENTSSIVHNVAIQDEGGNTMGEEGELVGEGETSEVTVDLEPGTYTYYCSPHESAGMTGTLTVS